jgi:hypothetical protein
VVSIRYNARESRAVRARWSSWRIILAGGRRVIGMKIRRGVVIAWTFAVVVVAAAPAVPGTGDAERWAEVQRLREIADFFFRWAASGEDHETLGVFPDAERVREAERIAVSCPFVPPRDITAIDPKYFDGACCGWGFPDFPVGECVQLFLTVHDEDEDRIEVAFGLSWASSAGSGRFYSCRWVDGELVVERVPNRILVI